MERLFEYPYVIITILVMGFLVMGAIGLYFSLRCIKNANGAEEKGFSAISTLEKVFRKSAKSKKNRTVVYIGISLDSMSRLYSEAKATRISALFRTVFLREFSVKAGGNIALCGSKGLIAITAENGSETKRRIEDCIAETGKILINNEAVNVAKVTFGYCCTQSTEVSFDTAVNRAKQACNMAEGNNVSYCEWDMDNGKKFEKKIKIENNIHSEIEENRFFLEYQPIVDAKTNAIIGAEVLSRLNSRSDGVLSPGAFLSAVNSVGLNEKFDYYIFEKNCKWISNDRAQREKYVYTINFSRSTLCDESFSENVVKIVDKYDLKYSCLAVEILEDKNLGENEKQRMIKNLTALKEKGVLILLDDFGKGYTSFMDLSKFDISIVKIDKEITQNAVNETGLLILKNILRTAGELGFKTLCEGVETEEQRKIVTDAGCDFIQGYYLYRPMPVTRLEEVFGDNKQK